jgi:hypothetical protein|uniref:Uncharacterized protein n=1 Tax=viral metagenome TaxID=1070528 RepID=A0A6C0DZN2_9ZZZZ
MSLIDILNSQHKSQLCADYNGNVYLIHNEKTFALSTDYDNGLVLILINNTKFLESNYNKSMYDTVEKGTIRPSTITLKGKIYETIAKDDEIQEHTENEIRMCDERKYYWVSKENNEEEENISDGFMFNSINDNNSGITYAKLLFEKLNTFDTILMDNKNVLSSIEKIDGYVNSTLVINTDGKVKVSFIDKNICGILVFQEDKLNFKLV